MSFPKDKISLKNAYKILIGSVKNDILDLTKEEDGNLLMVTLLYKESGVNFPLRMIKDIIGDGISKVFFGDLLPKAFISSAERTGAAIFHKELDFARNRLLNQTSSEQDIDPMKLLLSSYNTYALPVTDNVDFTVKWEMFRK